MMTQARQFAQSISLVSASQLFGIALGVCVGLCACSAIAIGEGLEPQAATATLARKLSADSSAYAAAQRRLPKTFATLQTDRFVLLSDADAFAMHQHGQWVERTCEEFERFARDCGIRPLPLQHKLVCVLFDEHEQYREFAKANDGMHNPTFTGYYSPRNDRVVFSLQRDSDRNAKPRRGSEKMLASGEKVLGFESQADGKPVAPHKHDESCGGHDSAGGAYASAAKCVHETIHQLMFHTRVMSPETQYPLWICEGLSTAFETDNPELPFGPDRDYGPRRRVFRNLLDQGEVISLRELVVLTSLSGKDPHLTRAVYHQSYALVTWLCRKHPDQVRAYLQAMALEPSGKLSAARHLELFERSFGKVGDVERKWLNHERAAAAAVDAGLAIARNE